MGWSGGIFTRVHDWTEDEAGGYDILSTRMDEEDDNFESGINACLHKAGQNSPTANLPMGGFIHTGVGLGTARDHYASVSQVQDGAFKYNTTAGSINAYTLSVTPAPAAYVSGQQFNFKANRTNGGATTLNVNSLGAKNVYNNGAACTGGEIVINRVYSVIYDGTQFHLVTGGSGGGGASYGGAKICMSSSQEVTNGYVVQVSFTTELYDDSNYFDLPVSGYGFKIPVTGRYRISGCIRWHTSTATLGESLGMARLYVNGSQRWDANWLVGIGALYAQSPYYAQPNVGFTWVGNLTAADVVTLGASQNNALGEPRSLYGNGSENGSTWMEIERLK